MGKKIEIELTDNQLEELLDIAATYQRWMDEGYSFEDSADMMLSFVGNLLTIFDSVVEQAASE